MKSRHILGAALALATLSAPARGEDDWARLFSDIDAIRRQVERNEMTQRALEDARREAARSAEIAATLRTKLAAAEAELETLRKANATLERLAQAAEVRVAADVMPQRDLPTVQVRGKVTSVSDAGLYVISVGSDDGVREGLVLDVLHAGDPQRIGTVTLVRAYGKQSIGQFAPDGAGRAAVGDEVSARIVQQK